MCIIRRHIGVNNIPFAVRKEKDGKKNTQRNIISLNGFRNAEDREMGNNVSWLTTVPATDVNFKDRLQYATVEEIKESLSVLAGKEEKGNKSRIAALSRELRKRERARSKEK